MKFPGLIVFLAACSFQASPQAGPVDTGGNTGGRDAGRDASTPIDAPAVAIDAPQCFGKGLVSVCLKTAPAGTKTMGATNFNTDTGCSETFTQASGPELCVVAAQNIAVTGAVTATGARALVLVASESITINDSGAIDVSSRSNPQARRGAAANTGVCST
ncbi:MAG TPA: hypothetical protein VFP84_23245, partial [Kofleriaceae bacterium]|nr:hypothetical protein [Kofleriaceae bacterium]